jgi:NitT/TauT family transport system substrate-binding protein
MTKFRVSATGHSINYLPEYLATELGYFAEEGLEVDATVPQPWTLVLDELREGSAQAALGGVWVPSMYLNRVKTYAPFAQLSARCPLVVMSREPDEAFDFTKVTHRTVLMPGSNGSSPGIFLKMLIREAGVNLADVNFIQDLTGPMLAELFVGGMGDYLLIDPLTATRLERQGGAHVVSYLAQSGGAVPWSVYYSEVSDDADSTELRVKFTRALHRATMWLREHDAEEIRSFIAATFPNSNVDDLVAHVNDLRAWGMWETARIDRASYERWQVGIVHGHLIGEPIPYDQFIDSVPADRAGVPQ